MTEEITTVAPQNQQADNTAENASESSDASTQTQTQQEQTPAKDPYSSSFAALARREREIREKEERLKVESSEIERLKNLQNSIQDNPLAIFDELGIDYQTVLNAYLDKTHPSEESQTQTLSKELEEIKRTLEEKEKLEKEKQLETEKQEILNKLEGFRNFAIQAMDNNEKLELIKTTNNYESVFQIIEDHFFKTNQLLDFMTVAEAVEDELEKQFEVFENTNKFKKRYASANENTKEPANREELLNKLASKSPTLSGSASASSGNVSNKKSLSKQDSLERAVAVMNGTSS